jgi:hypothetical protein
MVLSNGGRGIEINNNNVGSGAPFYLKYNTAWGNNNAPTEEYCQGNGELDIVEAFNVQSTNNLAETNAATGCGGYPIYAMTVSESNGTTVSNDNYAYGVNGNNTFLYASGSFAYGSGNVLGTNPSFANATTPAAPSCSGSANVPGCMATVISNFTPTVSAAKAYGYQQPSSGNVSDPLFPQWLCTVNLPSGLVTKGCAQ